MSIYITTPSGSIGGTIIGGTAGSILFINPANTLAQDNTNLFWDTVNTALKLQRTNVGATGTAAIPTLQISGGAVGLYTSGTNILGISTAGTEAIKIDASQNTTFTGYGAFPVGGVSNPCITFSDNLDTGFYEQTTGSSGNIALAINGSEAMRWTGVDNFGWHGTVPTASAFNAATVSTSSRAVFFAVDMTRTGIGGATLTILNFIIRPQVDVGANTGSFKCVVERNNPNRTFTGVLSDCGLGSTTTMASGTSNFYGVNFIPTAATGGNVTGGTLVFTGYRFATIPSNYAGGGATTTFRGSFFGDNLGSAYGNTDTAPDLLIYSDGTNGIASSTGEFQINANIRSTSTTLGFFNVSPVTQPTYTITNGTTDRSYDANSTTIDELADALSTLVADLRTYGLVL